MSKQSNEIPYKRLHRKEALDLAEAIARNDSKRLDDVVARVGGIDSSAFAAVLDTRGSKLNLIAEKESSGGLLARALSKSPDDVFDWLARAAQTPQAKIKAWIHFEGLRRADAFGHPRSMSKLIAACQRSGSVSAVVALVLGADVDEGRRPTAPRQAQAWSRARAESRELALGFLSSLDPADLDRIESALPKGAEAGRSRFSEARSIALARALNEQSFADALPRKPRFL